MGTAARATVHESKENNDQSRIRVEGDPHQPVIIQIEARTWENTKFVVHTIHNLSVHDVQIMQQRLGSDSFTKAIVVCLDYPPV